jgi:hypothetical protein
MNKGYAFGFFIVLLVLILGFYVAYTGFVSSREALRAQPTSPSATRAVRVVSTPTSPGPTLTSTLPIVSTPLPGNTATLTTVASGSATETPPPPTEPPAEPPPSPAPTQPPLDTPAPTVQVQPASPTTPPRYEFRLAGPPTADTSYPNCCYLYGTVRSSGGTPLEGIQVQAFNEWNTLPPATTKGGGEAGQYNIPIGQDAVTWNIVIIDGAGNRISTQVPVQFDPSVAGGYRVDWQRAY